MFSPTCWKRYRSKCNKASFSFMILYQHTFSLQYATIHMLHFSRRPQLPRGWGQVYIPAMPVAPSLGYWVRFNLRPLIIPWIGLKLCMFDDIPWILMLQWKLNIRIIAWWSKWDKRIWLKISKYNPINQDKITFWEIAWIGRILCHVFKFSEQEFLGNLLETL